MSTKGKTRNERTGAKVAKIAGTLLALDVLSGKECISVLWFDKGGYRKAALFKWSDIRALAASALTQAPNRTIRKSRKVAPKKPGWTQRRNLAKPKRKAKGTIADVHPPKRNPPKDHPWIAKNHRHREYLAKRGKW